VEEMNFSALKSKTVWWGILQAVAGVAVTVFQGGFTVESVGLFVASAITIVLRALTDTPLSEK